MSYLDKLYIKVPVTIYHTLWVIRLRGSSFGLIVEQCRFVHLFFGGFLYYDTAYSLLYLPMCL